MNKVILHGHLGQDPQVNDEKTRAVLNIATKSVWYDEGQKKEVTDWHRVVFFRGKAETCAKYLKKGSRVLVEGRLKTKSYEQDGETKFITEVHGKTLEF